MCFWAMILVGISKQVLNWRILNPLEPTSQGLGLGCGIWNQVADFEMSPDHIIGNIQKG